eukprot:6409886-Prymnesium_polylepis.1
MAIPVEKSAKHARTRSADGRRVFVLAGACRLRRLSPAGIFEPVARVLLGLLRLLRARAHEIEPHAKTP